MENDPASAQISPPFPAALPPNWRVTPANPPRAVDGIDYECCAALHNDLLEIAASRGQRLSIQDGETGPLALPNRATWFEHHGEEAEQVRDRLSPSLVKFLELAHVVDDISIFYSVNGLHYPPSLWLNHEDMAEDEDDRYRYLTLYAANNIASHPDGLVYVSS